MAADQRAGERQALLGTEEARRCAPGDRFRQAQRVCAETEELGMSILDDLRSQRETLERSKERLAGADGDLTRGSRILRSMGMRAQANKTITVGIAAVAFIAIVLLFWWR